jgi:intraflagellar transport protein 74
LHRYTLGGGLRPPTGLAALGAGAPLGALGGPLGGGGFRPTTGMAGMGDAMRPTTTATGGMGGAPARHAGPGRQVMDKSYFLNELRQKNKEIMLEVEKMTKDIHDRQMGNQQFDQIERKYTASLKEVKDLQGALADQNIILDTVGTGGPLDDLRQKTKMLHDRNAQERLQVDAVFGDRIQVESSVKELATQVTHHQEEMMAKLNELPPVKRREYQALAEENAKLQEEAARLEAELENAAHELSHLEHELSRDQIKQRALALQEKLSQLTARRYELEEEDKKLQLSPEEQRAQLKEQIRRDNADIQRAESQIQELQQAIRRGESKLQGVRMDLSEQQGGLDAADKYDKLLQQERELTEFIDDFEPNRAGVLNDCAAKQANVVQILERVSRHLQIKGNMPNQRRFKEMQDELEYKKVQVQNAAMTSDRLVEERQMRQQELEKISTLEDKIAVELKGLEEKTNGMAEEMNTFSDLEKLKVEAEEFKRKLERDAVSYGARKDALHSTTAEKNSKYEAKKEQLQGNELYSTLEKLEVKIRTAEQGIFSMSEYISSKEAETDHEALMGNIKVLYEELNQELQKRAMYT